MPREPSFGVMSDNLRFLGTVAERGGGHLARFSEKVGPEWGPVSPILRVLADVAGIQGEQLATESPKEQVLNALPLGKMLSAGLGVLFAGKHARHAAKAADYFKTMDKMGSNKPLPAVRVSKDGEELGTFTGWIHADAAVDGAEELGEDLFYGTETLLEEGYLTRSGKWLGVEDARAAGLDLEY